MSTLSLESVKEYLRVIHNDDDNMLQELLDSAESEVLSFLNADSFESVLAHFSVAFSTSSSESVLPPDIATQIKILVKADYEEQDPAKVAQWRDLVERRLFPYRMELGV